MNSFDLRLLLELKFTIRIVGRVAMVGIKLEGRGVKKKFGKLLMWSVHLMIWKIFVAKI